MTDAILARSRCAGVVAARSRLLWPLFASETAHFYGSLSRDLRPGRPVAW